MEREQVLRMRGSNTNSMGIIYPPRFSWRGLVPVDKVGEYLADGCIQEDTDQFDYQFGPDISKVEIINDRDDIAFAV